MWEVLGRWLLGMRVLRNTCVPWEWSEHQRNFPGEGDIYEIWRVSRGVLCEGNGMFKGHVTGRNAAWWRSWRKASVAQTQTAERSAWSTSAFMRRAEGRMCMLFWSLALQWWETINLLVLGRSVIESKLSWVNLSRSIQKALSLFEGSRGAQGRSHTWDEKFALLCVGRSLLQLSNTKGTMREQSPWLLFTEEKLPPPLPPNNKS